MIKTLITLTLTAIWISSVSGGEEILWSDDFSKFKPSASPESGWVIKDLSAEVLGDGIRLRETGPGSEGSLSRQIQYSPGMKFIQVKAGSAEHAENTFYLSRDGEKLKIFTGWNTFPVSRADISGDKLTITIIQDGPPDGIPGGWADLETVRVTAKPLDGLTIALNPGTRGDNTAVIGDTVVFRYYPEGSVPEEKLEADCFICPEISEYRFSAKPVILKKESGKTFSCSVKIDSDAYAFKSGGGRNVFANIQTNSGLSYAFTSFKINVSAIKGPDGKIKNTPPAAALKGANPNIIKYRKLWERLTEGNNLALGKDFVFSKKPDYRLTRRGDSDKSDLTDGKLSANKADKIWFDAAAVGWYMAGAENGVNCLLDLGGENPVGDVVIRALAGKEQGSLDAPQEFKVFVSRDGRDFYEAAGMTKLMESEKDLSDFQKNFYLEETGKAYVYPFRLRVNATARYAGLYIKGATGAVFLDEVAVMEGSEKTEGFNDAYKGKKEKFITSGIIVEPRLGELVISTNINTPNAFQLTDMRDEASSKKPARLIVEAPEGVNIISPEASQKPVEIDGKKYTRWELPLKRQGKQTEMIFFNAERSVKNGAPAFIFAESDGKVFEKTQAPLRLVEIPEIKTPFKSLMICLQWMGGQQISYPEFLKAYKALGFNAVPCFPRNWGPEGKDADIKWRKHLEEARKEGFAVSMNESPFHVMMEGHKPGSEIFSQLKNGKASDKLCPSYWGKYYEAEMDRVANCVKKSKPDYVIWDIECWYDGAKEAGGCVRCLEGQAKSGKSMEEYLKDCGSRKMKDLKDAVRRGAGDGKMPLIQCYNTRPTAPNYEMILDFNRFWPESVDLAGSSLYVVGNSQKVHDEIRENRKLLKCGKNLPWLSAGTYGEFPPHKLEQMILEALMNGACGILYFCYTDFDTPMDFYYHAKALAEIAPFEDLILDGEKLFDFAGSNKNLTYSAVKKDNEMLLLIGNYKRDPNGETEIILPFERVSEITDLRDNGKKLSPQKNFKTNIAKDEIGFYYIKGL